MSLVDYSDRRSHGGVFMFRWCLASRNCLTRFLRYWPDHGRTVMFRCSEKLQATKVGRSWRRTIFHRIGRDPSRLDPPDQRAAAGESKISEYSVRKRLGFTRASDPRISFRCLALFRSTLVLLFRYESAIDWLCLRCASNVSDQGYGTRGDVTTMLWYTPQVHYRVLTDETLQFFLGGFVFGAA